MSEKEDDLAKEIELLRSVENKGTGEKLKTYTKLCGPGWLQSAITLGGGSLIGALSLGAIGGSNFMWVQPLAMILGVIMLSAIAYVTLSTGQRPFKAINNHVSPVLGWGWLGARYDPSARAWCRNLGAVRASPCHDEAQAIGADSQSAPLHALSL